MKEKSQGLIALTQAVVERSFSDYILYQLTTEDMEVLSGIVLHYIVKLSKQECNMLTQLFGIDCEPKPLEDIREKFDITHKETLNLAREALQHLVDTSQIDIFKTLIDIKNEAARTE